MEPLWIIPLGTPTENIAKILTGYTDYSHISDADYAKWDDKYRWWHIDNYSDKNNDLIKTLSDFADNNAKDITTKDEAEKYKIPAIDTPEISTMSLNIVIIASVFDSSARNLFHSIPSALRSKKDKLFPGRSVKIFGMLYIPQSISKKTAKEREGILEFLTEINVLMDSNIPVANRPFDALFLFQDKNADPANRKGYNDIEDADVYDLISQVILHISVGNSSAFSKKFLLPGSTPYLHAGAVGIYYDYNNHLFSLSKELGEIILDKFKNSDDLPWVEESSQKVAISESLILKNISPEDLFENLKKNAPPFNFYSGIWAYPKGVSPFEFWKAGLIPVYFGIFTKNLIIRLVEYGRIAVKNAFEKFEIKLIENKDIILNDDSTAKRNIRDAVYSYWQNTSSSSPCGLVQAEQTIAKIRKNIEDFKNSARESTEKLNVFQVPGYIQEFYETSKDEFSIDEEKEIIEKIKNRLENQPVFSALLIRAFLTGVGLVFVGFPILSWISPNLINLKFLTDLPYIFPAILFLIPFCIALWIYSYRIHKPIRKNIKKYIAFILKPCQKKAKDKVNIYLNIIYDELDKYCDTLLVEIQEIREKWSYSDIPKSVFPDTMFQKNAISGDFNGEPILQSVTETSLLFSNGRTVSQIQRDKTEIYDLFKNILEINITDKNGENASLREYLVKRDYDILTKKIKEFCINGFKNSKKNLYELMLGENINPKIKEELLKITYPPGYIENYTDKVYTELKVNTDWTLPAIFDGTETTKTDSDYYFSMMRCRDIGKLNNFKFNFSENEIKEVSDKIQKKPEDSLIISCIYANNENMKVKLLDGTEVELMNDDNTKKFKEFKEKLK